MIKNLKLGQALVIAARENKDKNLEWALNVYFKGDRRKFETWYKKQGINPEGNAYFLRLNNEADKILGTDIENLSSSEFRALKKSASDLSKKIKDINIKKELEKLAGK